MMSRIFLVVLTSCVDPGCHYPLEPVANGQVRLGVQEQGLAVHYEDRADPPVAHGAGGFADRLVIVHPDGAGRHHVAHLGVHDVGLLRCRGCVYPVACATGSDVP